MIDWATWGIEAGINIHRLGKYTIDKSQLHIINGKLDDYYPGLLLPYRDKDEFTMPLPHFIALEGYLHYVETLVIIGWKGNEDAFNRILLAQSQKISKIIIVDPAPEVVEKNLQVLLDKQKLKPVYYKTFEDFVLNGLEKEIT